MEKSIFSAAALAVCLFPLSGLAGSYKHITIDGDFSDWAGVPVAYSQAPDTTLSIAYTNIFLANDDNYLYLRFAISTSDNPFLSTDNIFIDTDANTGTGFGAGGVVGSEMLIQSGAGYDQRNGSFNSGGVNGLDWLSAPAAPAYEFETRISRNAIFASDSTPVFTNQTIALVLESEDSTYTPQEWVPLISGGLMYTFAAAPSMLTSNLPLVTLTGSSWAVNGSGTDLGTAWIDPSYDDTQAGWGAGPGLFGYTPTPLLYPHISTALSSGPNTYYFRAHFNWNNLADNVAFVVTNYLSDGAVFYVNGVEVDRVRMPGGTITYSTAATSTNSPVGQASVFGIPGTLLTVGDNLLEVESHQAPGSSADMVFGASLTAAAQYPVIILDATQPADRTVNGGDPTTFSANILGSGPLSYQWLFDGNPISGATNLTYTISQVIYTNAGTYSLRIVNPLSTNTTRAATLTVTNTPVTLADPLQPQDAVVIQGRPLMLTSAAAGSPPIAYQWYFNSAPITGATNSTYALAAAALTNTGSYYVNASNPANATNSRAATVTVLQDKLPPVITAISASSTNLVVDFSEPLDPLTAADAAKYVINAGVNVVSATLNPSNPAEVTLVTSGMNLGVLYTLTATGVKDLFGNPSAASGSFTRGITIDGDFSDWNGLAPIYSGPSGTDGAADLKDLYIFNDANNYYFRVTLWHDIPPASGQFPLYANIYYDTDNNVNTGHLPGSIGSELLTQSGFGYQEKNGGFNEGGINNLGWNCLPATPNLDFEFSISRSATYASDGLPVFTTNFLNVHFEGQNTSFVPVNESPASGVASYTNVNITVPTLPVSRLATSALSGNRIAVFWEGTGTLQARGSLTSGTWTNVPGATAPCVLPATPGQLFFRLTQ